MKYFLFGGDFYDARGGARDYVATFDVQKEGDALVAAHAFIAHTQTLDWWHLADENFKIISAKKQV